MSVEAEWITGPVSFRVQDATAGVDEHHDMICKTVARRSVST